jgi:transcription antitermination factor NusA-like protein
MTCRVAWRDLSKAALHAEHFQRLATQLRGRGFQIELIEAATAFRVSW